MLDAFQQARRAALGSEPPLTQPQSSQQTQPQQTGPGQSGGQQAAQQTTPDQTVPLLRNPEPGATEPKTKPVICDPNQIYNAPDCQAEQQDFDALMQGHDVNKMLEDFARRKAEGSVNTRDPGLGIGSAASKGHVPLGHDLEWYLTHCGTHCVE